MDSPHILNVSRVIGSTLVWFLLRNAIPVVSYILFPAYKQFSVKDKTNWANHFVSLLHAVLAATLSTMAFATAPELFYDMVDAQNPYCEALLAMSTGYFIYDTMDMWSSGLYRNDVGIWTHHGVVIACFSSAIMVGKFSAYLAATLIVEWSGVFLHIRKLSLIANISPRSTFYSILAKLNVYAFILLRIVPTFALNAKVLLDRSTFPSMISWAIAASGMTLMSIYNVIFWGQIRKAEKRVMQNHSTNGKMGNKSEK